MKSTSVAKKNLKNLSADERTVLELLSLYYLPAGESSLVEALKRYGKPTLAQKAHDVLERLVESELVTRNGRSYRCLPEVVEIASQSAVEGKRFEKLQAALPPRSSIASALEDFPEGVRDLRLALYAGDKMEFVKRLASLVKRHPNHYNLDPPLSRMARLQTDTKWLQSMDDGLRTLVVQGVMLKGSQHLLPGATVAEWLAQQYKKEGDSISPFYRLLHLQNLLLSDEFRKVDRALADGPPLPSLKAWLEFEKGRYKKALAELEKALELAGREATGKVTLTGFASFLLPVSYLICDKIEEAKRYVDGLRGLDMEALHWLVTVRQRGGIEEPEWLPRFRRRDPRLDGLDALGAVLALYWAGCLEEAREFEDRMTGLARRANEAGYLWVERQARALVDRLNHREPEGKNPPLVDALKPAEAWRRSLDALLEVALQSGGSSGERVAWRVEEIDGQFGVRPYLQKRAKKGDWTGGRDILPARLLNQHGDVLLEQDRNALRTLVQGLDSYRVGDESTLAELVGHPYVFWEPDPSMRLEIQRGTPEIRVLEHEKEVQVDVQPVLPYFSADVGVLQEGPHRLRVYRLTENQKEIARILGKGLRVPVDAADELRQIVESLAPYIGVQSDLSGSFAGVKEIEADCKPNLFLIPHGVGLRLEMRVLPVGENGPAFPPSQGGRMVLAELKKIGRVQTSRDLEREFELGVEILEACPTITRFGPGGWNWVIDSPTDCLEVLEELQELPPGKLALHWPEGETMSVRKPAGLLKMEVKKSRDWFAVNGELEVDEDLVLDINALLERLQHSHGRFLQLEDGQFLALTDRFRQRLEQLADLRAENGQEVLLNPLAAAVALGEDVEGDKAWKEHVRQFNEAWSYQPEVPSTLRARLRQYQRDGFAWLGQLANLQTGACLADDMGLGKTLQALTVILSRAPQGPTLVVAPTSVCSNWLDEAHRFAPSLRPVIFAESDRAQVVQDAGPFDLIVCSYGLLTRETELLASRQWTTLVLDEAQAIKNFQTQRFKSAAALTADFRLATTGTPIENNLDELWTLFRFLNPGLLGDREQFRGRFSAPIEQGDKPARNRLRDLVRPFILRRLKSEVLDELPPRTEITLRVELSDEEKALYESLRRRALEELDEKGKEAQTLAVLAQLMKLRRACCHPQLVAPDQDIPASKMETFRELVLELLENGHKALVFSQFVDVLSLLREELDTHDISYQYLDGSTPAKERARRVADFQSGQGDLFLISLKAGGVGLNLTAADYVIHFDPWWNPAVEDQASDRAYRIGQQRPVTIYRLVSQGTVEEKIVELHRDKRELAAGLLDGSDQVAGMTSTDLLDLIRGTSLV